MTMPDLCAQSAEPMNAEQARQWFSDAAASLRGQGADTVRYAVNDADNPTIFLVEGWRQCPDWNKTPPPNFLMVNTKSGT